MRQKVFIATLAISAVLMLSATHSLAPSASAYPSTNIYVDPSTIAKYTNETYIGDTFQVYLAFGNMTNLEGFQFTLYWNRSVINVVHVFDTLPFFGSSVIVTNSTDNDFNATEGQMSFAVNATNIPFTGSATLRSVTFNITSAPATVNGSFLESAISWGRYGTETIFRNQQGNPIPATEYDGEFTYSYTPPVPEYTQLSPLLILALSVAIAAVLYRKRS